MALSLGEMKASINLEVPYFIILLPGGLFFRLDCYTVLIYYFQILQNIAMYTRLLKEHASLKDKVYLYLKDEIARGNLKPGERIKEKEIAQQFGISRTPIREALLQLEAEGFVKFLPRRGIIVRKLTVKEISDIWQTIGVLEGGAAALATLRMNKGDLSALERLTQKMQQALDGENYEEYNRLNLRFHETFLKKSGNDQLYQIIIRLKKRIYEHPVKMVTIPEWERKAFREHLDLLKIFKQRDAQRAETFLREVHWNLEENLPFMLKAYSLEE